MAHPFLRSERDGTVVTVWAVPGAKRTEIVGVHGDALKIRVAAPPEAGKANRAIVRLLASTTGANDVQLLRGATARRKEFLLAALTPEQVSASLGVSPR